MSEKRLSLLHWPKLWKWPQMLDLRQPTPERQIARIRLMERDIGLPVKAAVLIVLFYYFFLSNWFDVVTGSTSRKNVDTPHEIVLQFIPPFYMAYLLINGAVATLLFGLRHFSLQTIQKVVFINCFIDALFFSALTLVTNGFESFLYWVFLVLIIRNTVSIPSPRRQMVMNLLVGTFYFLAGVAGSFLSQWQYTFTSEDLRLSLGLTPGNTWFNEAFLLRFSLLIFNAICCYGVQVIMEKQRRADEETREFTLRQEQLQATGRLAAEIAHQLKNPLGIINNAAYTLQKTVKEGKTITQQIRIIREEVERSDRILTELMGYARLSEGQVEKLDITEELDRAINQVFPPAARYDVTISRDYGAALPALLAQRGHMSEVFVNILQNAREAMNGHGNINITARYGDEYRIIVTIEDNGPGIPSEKLPKIFEPYFTTKERGTGLGLAIVKHNTELYNGSVQVKSEPGKGATFVVSLPAKTVFNLRK